MKYSKVLGVGSIILMISAVTIEQEKLCIWLAMMQCSIGAMICKLIETK